MSTPTPSTVQARVNIEISELVDGVIAAFVSRWEEHGDHPDDNLDDGQRFFHDDVRAFVRKALQIFSGRHGMKTKLECLADRYAEQVLAGYYAYATPEHGGCDMLADMFDAFVTDELSHITVAMIISNIPQ